MSNENQIGYRLSLSLSDGSVGKRQDDFEDIIISEEKLKHFPGREMMLAFIVKTIMSAINPSNNPEGVFASTNLTANREGGENELRALFSLQKIGGESLPEEGLVFEKLIASILSSYYFD